MLNKYGIGGSPSDFQNTGSICETTYERLFYQRDISDMVGLVFEGTYTSAIPQKAYINLNEYFNKRLL